MKYKFLVIAFCFFALTAEAAPQYIFQKGIMPEVDNTYFLGSTSPALRWKAIILGTATSTGDNGFNITSGCFAINNVCIGGSTLTGSGTQGQLAYWTGTTALGSVATTTVSCSGNTSCTGFVAIGGSPITISSTGGGTGLATSSPISDSNVLVYSSSAGAGSAYGAGTTTLVGTGIVNVSNSPVVLGSSGAVVSLTGGTNGQILGWLGGVPTWTATTTYSNGLAYSNGNVTNTLTAGDGLTRTVDDIDCDTANGSTFGCLLAIDWTTFNNKVSSSSLITYVDGVKDWQLTTNIFGQSALTPTTTQNIHVSGVGTSTFKGGLEAWRQISAPYFHATSTTATSTFAGDLIISGTKHLFTHGIQANDSAGIHLHSNNGTEVGYIGAGGGANITWLGTTLFSGITTDVITGTNEDLTISPNGTGGVLITSSTTLQNFTGRNATVSQATTTTLHVSGSATSTQIANGINLLAGCFAINNVCVGSNNGTVTSIATTYPVLGGTITNTGTISLAFGTTTANNWGLHNTFTSIFGIIATITDATTTNLHITSLTSALLQADANGRVQEYVGSNCGANTFAQTLSALGILTCDNVDLATADVTGTLPVGNGGTGDTDLDDILGTSNQIVVTDGANTIIGGDATLALSNHVIFPSSFQVTESTTTYATTSVFAITGTGTSTFAGGVNLTSGCFAISNVCVGTNTGTVTSVDMTVPTGLSISGNPITTSGTLALTYASGYAGVLTASTTNWNGFYDVPSTRITAGTGIDWSGNTLNGVYTAGDGLTLNTEDFDCDTASASVFGCLASADYITFTNKLSAYDAWTHPSVGVSATTSGLIISASSTVSGDFTISGNSTTTGKINVGGTATSTFTGNGINLSDGCFAIDSVCLGVAGSGAGGYVAYWINGNTLSASSNFSFASADEGILTTGIVQADTRMRIGTTTNARELAIYGSIIASSTGSRATSSFVGQSIDLVTGQTGTVGCFAINGTCLGASSGTVTSIDVSGGTTGLTYSGGPVTTSGTITMAGTLARSNGGTGMTTYTTGSVIFASASKLIEDATNFFWDDTNDFLGLGTAVPTARLDIRGAATATPPLVLWPSGTAGTATTTNSFWNSSASNQFSSYTGGLKLEYNGTMFRNATITSFRNSNTATSIIPPVVLGNMVEGTTTIPANFLTPGMHVNIKVTQLVKNVTAPVTVTQGVYMNGTLICSATNVHTGTGSDKNMETIVSLVFMQSGATTQAWCSGKIFGVTLTGTSFGPGFMTNTAPVTVDLTVPQNIDVRTTWGTASLGNQATTTEAIIRIE